MTPGSVMKKVCEMFLFSFVLAIILTATESEKRSVARTINVKKDGVITSPNYPLVYPNNYEGIWKFEVPPDHRLELVFNVFDLEGGNHDYVSVYDGPLESRHQIGVFSGDTKPPRIIKSTSREIFMIFRTDSSVTRLGFKVTHTTKFNIDTIVSSQTKGALIQYFLNKRQQTFTTKKWGVDITRTAVALFLTDKRFFDADNKTGEEIAYELTLQLMSKLVMKKQISTEDLALFVNAMTVACINPKSFFGLDVVAGLRKRVHMNNNTNPFFLLALCIAGGDMSIDDVHLLQKHFDAHIRPSWTGTQAMVVLALKCISQRTDINLDAVLEEMITILKEKQQNNGTVENIKTTALVVQALLATDNYKTNFNMSMAIKSLIKNTQLSTEINYYIVPVIMWRSLLDINSNHCGNFFKTDLKEMNDLTLRHSDERIHVQISIIIGDDTDFTRTWRIKVPENASLYQVMENIGVSDPDYKLQYTIVDGKPFIAGLSHYEDSIEKGLFWFIYTKKLSSNDDLVPVEKSPVDIQASESDELILWYRSDPWPNTQTVSTDLSTTDSPSTDSTDVVFKDVTNASATDPTDMTY